MMDAALCRLTLVVSLGLSRPPNIPENAAAAERISVSRRTRLNEEPNVEVVAFLILEQLKEKVFVVVGFQVCSIEHDIVQFSIFFVYFGNAVELFAIKSIRMQ